MNNKFYKNKKGITLIALVITIIVLLLLAGISISMLSGQDGILNKASLAKLLNKDAEIEDALNILAAEVELAKYAAEPETSLPTDAAGVINYLVNDKKVVEDGELEVKGIQTIGYVERSKKFSLEGIVEWPTDVQEGLTLSADGKTVTGYTGDGGEVIIPNGVTSIGEAAFWGQSSLTNIMIPSSVTSIGEACFQECDRLTTVELNGLITSIEPYAFSMCVSLKNIEIPSSVTYIGGSAFFGCSELENVKIPEGVTYIGDSAFSGCMSLNNITIPSTVTSTGYCSFSNCESLTNLKISEGVTSIESGSFTACTSLTNVEIPFSVTSIGEVAFEYCTSLTNIEIPATVTSIGKNAFNLCENLYVLVKAESPFKFADKATHMSSWGITDANKLDYEDKT